MEQHIKTDLKVLVKEADKERPVSYSLPANIYADVTEDKILQIGDALAPILPEQATVSSLVKTDQTSYTPTTEPEPQP